MFLCEDYFRRNKLREKTEVVFYGASPVYFPPCKKFSDTIVSIASGKGIKSQFNQALIALNKEKSVATFKDSSGTISEVSFDFMHFVPP